MGVMNPRYTIFRKPKESMRDIYIYIYIYIYKQKIFYIKPTKLEQMQNTSTTTIDENRIANTFAASFSN